MNDFLSELRQEKTHTIAAGPPSASYSKEAKNVKAVCRYLEIEGPGVHEFLQYSHFYKARIGSGELELVFTNDVVRIEGTQRLLISIAQEVSLNTLPGIRAVDITHATVLGMVEYVSRVGVRKI